MLAGVITKGKKQTADHTNGEADVVVVSAEDSDGYLAATKGLDAGDTALGALLPSLEAQAASALSEAECDFAISPLAGTAAVAIDQESMGHVIGVTLDETEAVLRSIGPLGLDALFVEAESGELSLSRQLEFVRLASFTSTPLLVTVPAGLSVAELRVLRDSGVAAVILPAGSSADQLAELVENLKAVPAPSRGRSGSSGDVAIVPAAHSAAEELDPEPDEDDE